MRSNYTWCRSQIAKRIENIKHGDEICPAYITCLAHDRALRVVRVSRRGQSQASRGGGEDRDGSQSRGSGRQDQADQRRTHEGSRSLGDRSLEAGAGEVARAPEEVREAEEVHQGAVAEGEDAETRIQKALVLSVLIVVVEISRR